MIKIYNKIVESIKAPENKNDIWLNKGVFHIYKQGDWKPFTVDLATANKLKEMAEKGVLLTPGEGIIIEDNEINLTLKTVNGESIIGEGNIVIEGVKSYDDTQIKNDISNLSTQVDELTERVEGLEQGGQGGDSSESEYDKLIRLKNNPYVLEIGKPVPKELLTLDFNGDESLINLDLYNSSVYQYAKIQDEDFDGSIIKEFESHYMISQFMVIGEPHFTYIIRNGILIKEIFGDDTDSDFSA